MLPRSEAVLAYVDVKALRYSGLLERIAGSKTAEEPEYKSFLQETGFDYKRDIDAIAAAFRDGHVFFVVQGNFDWKRLANYAEQNGGRCQGQFCRIPGSKPDRKVSFLEVQRGVLGVAVSTDESAASELAPRPHALEDVPEQPVWVQLPHSFLAKPDVLPAGASSIARALSLADRVIFSISNEASSANEMKLALHLDARFDSNMKAELVQKQLETVTELLKRLLAQEAKKDPNPGDLSGLLAAGTFRQVQDQVLGEWPVRKELLDTLLQ